MPTLHCRVGDVALVVRGVWAGMVVDVLRYDWAAPGFDWVVRSLGSPFPFAEFGFPESVMARARDDYLEPLRPDPEEDVAELFAASNTEAAAPARGLT